MGPKPTPMHFSLRTSISASLSRFLELIVVCVCVGSVSEEEVGWVGRGAASPFLTGSILQNVIEGHTIKPNGYNLGR
jgi:hypothetical protein